MGLRLLRLEHFDRPGVQLRDSYVVFNDEPDRVYLTSGVEVTGAELDRARKLFAEGTQQ